MAEATSHQPTPDAGTPIAASSYSDSDSSYGGDDQASYTTSLRSSIMDYKMKNNRRYHAYKEGSYILPNDNQEMERLDMMHQMAMVVKQDRLYTAPVKNPTRILDLGCGTGIWAIEMGDEFPEAEVVGVDNPIQPSMVPPNVQFEVDDIESEWTYTRPFSFIHAAYLLGAMNDHGHVFEQAYDHLEPGGWCEAYDYNLIYESSDGSWKKDDAMQRWVEAVDESMLKAGRESAPGNKLEGWFKKAGFTNVKATKTNVPIGPWAADRRLKTIGAWNLVQILEGFEGFSLFLLNQVLGWTVDEVQALLAEARRNIQNPHKHIYYSATVCIGQKPYDDSAKPGADPSVPATTAAAPASTSAAPASSSTAAPVSTTTAPATTAAAPATGSTTTTAHAANASATAPSTAVTGTSSATGAEPTKTS